MKLIDVRQTGYGKVADVQLDNADLSFSMPYSDYCELEAAGRLTEDTSIGSNIHFMQMIHEFKIPYQAARDEIDQEPLDLPKIKDGVSSHAWFEAQKERPY